MDPAAEQMQLLLDIEARHDDLLRQLDELERRVADVLAQYQPPKMPETPGQAPAAAVPFVAAPDAEQRAPRKLRRAA